MEKKNRGMEHFEIIENRMTTTVQVYDILRQRIIDLILEPGTSMSEKDISEKLNVSRTPVRESFIRLSREGLVNIYPQKGTVVSKISIARAFEERFIRETLETAVLMEFIGICDDNIIEELEAIIQEQEEATVLGEYKEAWDCDLKFHNTFFKYTNNNLSLDIINNYSVNYYRIRRLSVAAEYNAIMVNLEQHKELLSAIKRKNLEEAHKILSEHLRKFRNDINQIVTDNHEYFLDLEVLDTIK